MIRTLTCEVSVSTGYRMLMFKTFALGNFLMIPYLPSLHHTSNLEHNPTKQNQNETAQFLKKGKKYKNKKIGSFLKGA